MTAERTTEHYVLVPVRMPKPLHVWVKDYAARETEGNVSMAVRKVLYAERTREMEADR